MLPYLGEQPLSDELESGTIDLGIYPLTLPAYVCPSDPYSDDGQGCANFFANHGTGLQKYGYNGFLAPDPQECPIGAWMTPHRHGPTRPQDIRDGLSRTVAISECLVPLTLEEMTTANSGNAGDLRRAIWKTDRLLVRGEDLEERAGLCRRVGELNVPAATKLRGRYSWASTAGPEGWGYDHVLTPNSPTCVGIYSAGSAHPGGVNVLYADGHTGFVSDAIDQSVWSKAGARDDSVLD